jgi:TatD DNase family protein
MLFFSANLGNFITMQYIDLHTHQSIQEGFIQLRNVFAQDLPVIQADFLFSTGLHPWHVESVNSEECFRAIEQSISEQNMVAIGECGLDRSIKANFALQEKLFVRQIELADKYHKPLIIHCVRAYSDLLKLKNETKSRVPWILHGFRANLEMTVSLVKHGFYFSIGENLLKDFSKHEILKQIPPERLFLETDDSELSIQKIYLSAARILEIDPDSLAEAIFNNFKILFGEIKLS